MSRLSVGLLVLCAFAATAQERASDSSHRVIEQVMSHPLFDTAYVCAEHPAGALPLLGDDLGQDCIVQAMVANKDGGFMRSYRTDGLDNADWFGWNHEVLSPCDCSVLMTRENPITNIPGTVGTPPASFILMRTTDGTFFVIAHVQGLQVAKGETVKQGQPIAHVGNNGFARMPHIHVGAWRGPDALQIRWNQQQMASQ